MDKQLLDFFGAAKRLRLTEEEKAASLERLPFSPLAKAKSLSLSAKQKEQSRTAIESFMKMRPIRQSSPETTTGISWLFTFHRFAALSMCVVLLMGMGGGVAYAADDAMPEDLLYPVKLHFNEPVIDVLSFTPARKARWAAKRLERRLGEAEHLSNVKQLTPEHRERMAKHIEERMSLLQERISSLPEEEQEQLDNRIQERLDRHEAFLEKLETGEVSREEVRKLHEHVRGARQKFKRPRPGIDRSPKKRPMELEGRVAPQRRGSQRMDRGTR